MDAAADVLSGDDPLQQRHQLLALRGAHPLRQLLLVLGRDLAVAESRT